MRGEGEAAHPNSLERIPYFVEKERRRCRRLDSVGGGAADPEILGPDVSERKTGRPLRQRRKSRKKCGI